MFFKLKEILLPYLIKIMHKKETLTQKERNAQEAFLSQLKVIPRKTKQPVVAAFIGLIGSGKTSVARELAKNISATVIEADAIRVYLRKEGERYEGARKIAENVMAVIIERGGNVVIDSDHIDQKKRASLREKARKVGAKLVFIRIHCDRDVMFGRVIGTQYPASPADFFGGAGLKSKWQGKNAGVVVKIREIWRRTPHHYRWDPKGGGSWILKKLPFPVFTSIDTTDPEKWQTEVKKVAQKLLKF